MSPARKKYNNGFLNSYIIIINFLSPCCRTSKFKLKVVSSNNHKLHLGKMKKEIKIQNANINAKTERLHQNIESANQVAFAAPHKVTKASCNWSYPHRCWTWQLETSKGESQKKFERNTSFAAQNNSMRAQIQSVLKTKNWIENSCMQ